MQQTQNVAPVANQKKNDITKDELTGLKMPDKGQSVNNDGAPVNPVKEEKGAEGSMGSGQRQDDN